MEAENQIKVVFLGASGVGKSSILQRFSTGTFSQSIQMTLGAAFISKKITVKGKIVKFEIWDTAGEEKYHSISQMYYRDSSVAILVFDVTSKKSFEEMKHWREELQEKGPHDIVICIVGNKTDLLQEKTDGDDDGLDFLKDSKSKPVDLALASEYAMQVGAYYCTTSAKFDKGISDLFEKIAEIVPNKESRPKHELLKPDDDDSQGKRSRVCCK